MKTPHTIVELFLQRVASSGPQEAILVPEGDEFRAISWNALAADARALAARMRGELGVKRGDRVVQVSENRYEWIVLDLAIHLVGAVHVAVHATLTGEQIEYQILDSGAQLVVVSTPEQAAKLGAIATRVPASAHFASFEACETLPDGRKFSPLDIGKPVSVADDYEAFEAATLAATHADTLATILYTSGTTGEPKGVMLSHGNLVSNTLATIAAFEIDAADLRLCWLPLSHVYARTSDYYTWIGRGSVLALAKSRETILADCRKLQPTIINGVPYFYDKIMRHLQESGQADVPGKLTELLGGRMRVCCSGGAALSNHVAEFFAQRGLLLVQGYGLTESSPVITTCSPTAQCLGTVGPPIPGVEVKIAGDGEVLTRGPHVMQGYWNKPEATAEVIRDGWLHTGDLGQLEDGFLRITGRKKELIVTAGGKNIAPVQLEALLLQEPLIAQVMVIGDGRNYLTALIVPDRDRLRSWIIENRIPVTSAAEALVHPQVRARYAEAISRQLSGVSNCEQVRRFTLLGRGFTIETGELTPTLKLRRSVVLANFAAEVQQMYAAETASNSDCGL